MKILLFGEFSALHKNLKDGLEKHGHHVTIASEGDGWKQIAGDIDWSSKKRGTLGKIDKIYKCFMAIAKMKNYDVVQMISPVVFPRKYGLNDYAVKKIFSENGKVFLTGAGCNDTVTAIFLRDKYKYPEWFKHIDKSTNGKLWCLSEQGQKYNRMLLERIRGFIPIMYEYAQGYRDIQYEKLCPTIPIPMNLDKVQYQENNVKAKMVVFHGLNREDIKGTPFIREAMEKVKSKYPNDVEMVIDGKMPLDKYLELLKRVNVVVDQTYSSSYGVNAVYSMGLGKVVLGGGEEECLAEFGIQSAPIIPIKPQSKDIEEKLIALLDRRKEIPEMGFLSRKYVAEVHADTKIAEQYDRVWNNR